MGEARISAIGVRYYGELAAEDNQLLGARCSKGCSRRDPVVGRRDAGQRAHHRDRARHRADRVAQHPLAQLHEPHLGEAAHDAGERWVEGTVFANGSLRLVLVDGVGVESPLEGTLLIIKNNDQPGVIGDVGTLLGRHKVNIANFALGRDPECRVDCAIGVVKVDEHPETDAGMVTDEVLAEIQSDAEHPSVWRVRLETKVPVRFRRFSPRRPEPVPQYDAVRLQPDTSIPAAQRLQP